MHDASAQPTDVLEDRSSADPVRVPIGLVVIGDEILSGKRRDRHFEALRGLCAARGLGVTFVRYVGDALDGLVQTFRETLAFVERERAGGGEPLVLSFGGIGATPDDRTRQALAQAAGVALERQPDAVRLIEARFGADAYPTRIRMAEMPAGAGIVPNPVNQVPGVWFRDHALVPGFPNMAHPMCAWVLDQRLAGIPPERRPRAPVERRLWVRVPESELVPLLEALCAAYPAVQVSSLPTHRPDDGPRVELGVRGAPEAVAAAFSALQTALAEAAVDAELAPPVGVGTGDAPCEA